MGNLLKKLKIQKHNQTYVDQLVGGRALTWDVELNELTLVVVHTDLLLVWGHVVVGYRDHLKGEYDYVVKQNLYYCKK